MEEPSEVHEGNAPGQSPEVVPRLFQFICRRWCAVASAVFGLIPTGGNNAGSPPSVKAGRNKPDKNCGTTGIATPNIPDEREAETPPTDFVSRQDAFSYAAPLRVKRRTACAGLRRERCSLQRGGSNAYWQTRQAYLQCVTGRAFIMYPWRNWQTPPPQKRPARKGCRFNSCRVHHCALRIFSWRRG